MMDLLGSIFHVDEWQAQLIHTKSYIEPPIIVKFVTNPHASKLNDISYGNDIILAYSNTLEP